MRKPMIPSSVISSAPPLRESREVQESDSHDTGIESEVVYYTVRGRRRRRRDADPDLFRKLCVWYGTIPAPDAMSELSQQADASHEQGFPARDHDDIGWDDVAEDTLPLPHLPFAVEGEALA